MSEGIYGKPTMSGINAGDEEEDDDYMKEDYGIDN
jgi:hypothetical protein